MSSKPKRSRPDEDQIDKGKTNAGSSASPRYADSYIRIRKDNLYMIVALWMEDFVDTFPKSTYKVTESLYNKVGAVLVLPNDVIFAADCSRDGVHAVARLLMKHHQKLEGCMMFTSRKPCPICAKLLVQSKVKRVLYLPREPEYYRGLHKRDSEEETREKIDEINNTQMKQVDNLFTASAIAQTKFVLQVENAVLDDAELKTPSKAAEEEINSEKERLIKEYGTGYGKNREWKESIKEKLPWSAFDTEIDGRVQIYFANAMQWMARVRVLSGRGLNYEFKLCGCEQAEDADDVFDPVKKPFHTEQARHFITIARFLAERTDDPKTGVGAVIVNPKMEILAFGWNGFPFKAYYAEFARASRSDESTDNKKYPYIIHAEQNAILLRNNKNIEGAILFVTKLPCNECAPVIAMEGIKTVVVDDDVLSRDETTQKNGLGYDMFLDMVNKKQFVCYQTRKLETGPSKASEGPPSAVRKL